MNKKKNHNRGMKVRIKEGQENEQILCFMLEHNLHSQNTVFKHETNYHCLSLTQK